MHQNRFRLGLCPRPRWGSLQRSPDPLAGFKGPTSKGMEEGMGGALDLAVCLLFWQSWLYGPDIRLETCSRPKECNCTLLRSRVTRSGATRNLCWGEFVLFLICFDVHSMTQFHRLLSHSFPQTEAAKLLLNNC